MQTKNIIISAVVVFSWIGCHTDIKGMFERKPTYIEKVKIKLIKAESDFMTNAISYKKKYKYIKKVVTNGSQVNYFHIQKLISKKPLARGHWQITQTGLDYYNTFNGDGRKYKIMQMHNKKIANIVGNWLFDTAYSHYNRCLVKTVNSYNMGYGNTAKGKYNHGYLMKIVPIEWMKFKKKYKHKKYTKITRIDI